MRINFRLETVEKPVGAFFRIRVSDGDRYSHVHVDALGPQAVARGIHLSDSFALNMEAYAWSSFVKRRGGGEYTESEYPAWGR